MIAQDYEHEINAGSPICCPLCPRQFTRIPDHAIVDDRPAATRSSSGSSSRARCSPLCGSDPGQGSALAGGALDPDPGCLKGRSPGLRTTDATGLDEKPMDVVDFQPWRQLKGPDLSSRRVVLLLLRISRAPPGHAHSVDKLSEGSGLWMTGDCAPVRRGADQNGNLEVVCSMLCAGSRWGSPLSLASLCLNHAAREIN